MGANLNSSAGGSNSWWEKFGYVTGGVVAGAGVASVNYKSKGHKLQSEQHGAYLLFKCQAPKAAVSSFQDAHLSDMRINAYLEDFWCTPAGQSWQENQDIFEPGTISYKSRTTSLFGKRAGNLVGDPRQSLRRPKSLKKIENRFESGKITKLSFSSDNNSIQNFSNPVCQQNFVNLNCSESQVINSISIPFRDQNGEIHFHRLYEISLNQGFNTNKPEREKVFVEIYSENNLKYVLESDIGVVCCSITLSLLSLVLALQVYKFVLRYFIKFWKEPDEITKIILAYNKKELTYEQAFIILCTQYNQTRWQAIDLLEPAYDIDILQLLDKMDSNTQRMLESYIENDEDKRSNQPYDSQKQLYSTSKNSSFSRRSIVSKKYLSKLKRKPYTEQNILIKRFLTFFETVWSCIFYLFTSLGQLIYAFFFYLLSFIGRVFNGKDKFWR